MATRQRIAFNLVDVPAAGTEGAHGRLGLNYNYSYPYLAIDPGFKVEPVYAGP
jgi:hypothetical protein